MTITKRADKGVALTYGELDENFRDLDSDMTLDRVLKNGDSSNRDIVLTGTATLTTPNLAADSAYFSNLSYASLNGLASGDYLPGQTIQEHWYRYDSHYRETINTGAVAGQRFPAEDSDDFRNRLMHVEPLDVGITLVKSNSLVVIEWNIFQETNAGSTVGFLIAESDESGNGFDAAVIRREGYEGYNSETLRLYKATGTVNYAWNNTFHGSLYDGNDASTPEVTTMKYFDKPGVSGYKKYKVIFKDTTGSNRVLNINRSHSNAGATAANYEHGVTTIQIREIAQ